MLLAENMPLIVDTLLEHGANIEARSHDDKLGILTRRLRVSFTTPRFINYHSTTIQVAVATAAISVIIRLCQVYLNLLPQIQLGLNKSAKTSMEAVAGFINTEDDIDRTALHYLVDRKTKRISEGQVLMETLLLYGADPSVVSAEGVTSLHVAAAIGSSDVITKMLDAGALPGVVDYNGCTALHAAALSYCASHEAVKSLISAGTDPHAVDLEGQTALHYAAASCNTGILDALLKFWRSSVNDKQFYPP